jgi:creatinine amidohydrolase
MDKSRLMAEMTVKQVREGLKTMKTIILPVGIVEQHGYHLPLSVDIHNAVELAARTSALCGCFVAPSLNYCFSGGTLPGTINLSPQTFSLVLMDICRSLKVQGFKNTVVLLGHGGSENTKSAREALEMFQRLDPQMEGITLSLVPFWELSPTYMKSFEERDYHAGRYETSMMLYWKPELVHMEEACVDKPEVAARLREDPDAYLSSSKAMDSEFIVPKLVQCPDIEVGVLGNPAGANAELGRQIAGEVASNLSAYVERLEATRS